MAINNTPKEMPTGDGNPTAGNAINDLDFPTGERSDKTFSSLRVQFVLRGHSLHRSHPDDGPVSFWAERWGLVRHLDTLADARDFLTQIGGANG